MAGERSDTGSIILNLSRTLKRMNTKGLTLIELIISMGVSALVVMSSLTFFMATQGNIKDITGKTRLGSDILLLGDYLGSELQNLGGGRIRWWASLLVEDNCVSLGDLPHCQGSDRMTVLVSTYPEKECSIVRSVSGDTLEIESTDGCCLTSDFAGKHAMITRNENYIQKYIESIDLNSCEVNLQDGPMTSIHAANGISDWSDGVLTLVEVKSYYVDVDSRKLKVFRDFNNNQKIDDGEDRVLAMNVYDLQVSLGFDFKPIDGVVTDYNNDEDEWAFNSGSVNEELDGSFFRDASRDQLRLVNLGLIVGRSGGQQGQHDRTAQVLNGPTRSVSGKRLYRSEVRVMPRNNAVYR